MNEDAKRLPGLRYCDVRIQVKEEKGAVAENGNEKMSAEDYAFDFGVRVIAGGRTSAPGYYGRVLGATDMDRIGEVVRDGIRQAHHRARASARMKAGVSKRFGPLGESLYSMALAPVTVARDTVPATYRDDPREVPLEDAVRMAVDSCRAAQGVSDQIVYCAASATTTLMRELFVSSEGADIDQSFAQTEGFVIAICNSEHGTLEIYDFSGHQRGWEVLSDGYDNGTIVLPDFVSFCKKLGTDAVEVANSPPLKPPDKPVVVVTDPHFNTLLVHEVVGHPSELDRGLKYETSYAGRSWFLKDVNDNQIGRQIASPLVNAYSDLHRGWVRLLRLRPRRHPGAACLPHTRRQLRGVPEQPADGGHPGGGAQRLRPSHRGQPNPAYTHDQHRLRPRRPGPPGDHLRGGGRLLRLGAPRPVGVRGPGETSASPP